MMHQTHMSRRRHGHSRQIPKHLRVLSHDIVNALMRERPLPYQLARKFGISADAALEIYDLAPYAFGPGGAGFDWAVKKTASIVGKPRKAGS